MVKGREVRPLQQQRCVRTKRFTREQQQHLSSLPSASTSQQITLFLLPVTECLNKMESSSFRVQREKTRLQHILRLL